MTLCDVLFEHAVEMIQYRFSFSDPCCTHTLSKGWQVTHGLINEISITLSNAITPTEWPAFMCSRWNKFFSEFESRSMVFITVDLAFYHSHNMPLQ